MVLLSGGLDSILAVQLLKEQGMKVTALSFRSYFFNEKAAKTAADHLKVPLMVVDFSQDHLAMLKNAPHGYGKAMNPCIDCHALMLKKAKEIMEKDGFDLVATGEVLGERPMSQNIGALKTVEKESSLSGYLLRPLSAKLLPPTIPEKKGMVERSKLLDISGRSRKRQMSLAKKWKIKQYPTPAGGCLLTDLSFGQKLKSLLAACPDCQGNDLILLRYGRHFWEGKVKIVVGRNEQEDEEIRKLAREKDILIEMKNYTGPLTLVRDYSKNETSNDIIEKAKNLTQFYSAKARGKKDVEF